MAKDFNHGVCVELGADAHLASQALDPEEGVDIDGDARLAAKRLTEIALEGGEAQGAGIFCGLVGEHPLHRVGAHAAFTVVEENGPGAESLKRPLG